MVVRDPAGRFAECREVVAGMVPVARVMQPVGQLQGYPGQYEIIFR